MGLCFVTLLKALIFQNQLIYERPDFKLVLTEMDDVGRCSIGNKPRFLGLIVMNYDILCDWLLITSLIGKCSLAVKLFLRRKVRFYMQLGYTAGEFLESQIRIFFRIDFVVMLALDLCLCHRKRANSLDKFLAVISLVILPAYLVFHL